MNRSLLRPLALAACLCLLLLTHAGASPGAHGPNGEHLDGPAAAASGAGLPRIEAHSEAFEIVGRLQAQGLVLYISRYETNEAVLGAKVDVELGNSKANATFQAEAGTYVVTDKALMAVLAQAGSHALVFTITAGADSDLLDGTLVVAAHADQAHGAASGLSVRSGIAALAGFGLLVAVVLVLRRRSRNNAFGAA
ncbi:MAG TPA: hypothetical protein VGE36_16865 [Roseateles sp.]